MAHSMKATGSNQKDYYLFDSTAMSLGRIASRAAFILQGKHKPDYEPQKAEGDFVVVTNIAEPKVTGKKTSDKKYHSFSGYPGGITTKKMADLLKENPERIIREAVYNMLPKNKLRDRMMKRLLIVRDGNHGLKVKFKEAK